MIQPKRKWSFRKSYWINPKFQIAVILRFSIVAIIVIAATFLTVNYSFWQLASESRAIGLPDSHPFFKFIESRQAVQNSLLVYLAVGSFVFIVGYGTMFSHKIAGPLYRLNLHMWQVSRGQGRSRVSFRKKDFFKELCDSYNAQYEALSSRGSSTNQIDPTDEELGPSRKDDISLKGA